MPELFLAVNGLVWSWINRNTLKVWSRVRLAQLRSKVLGSSHE